jgi:phosphate transport system permease protein
MIEAEATTVTSHLRSAPGAAQARRSWFDRLGYLGMAATAAAFLALLVAIGLALLAKSWPLLATRSLLHLLASSTWRPLANQFGFRPFILGTFWVTGVALIVSVPVSVLCAIYLAEYAGRRARAAAKPLLDLLAGIPPVVYGLWGVLAIVPLVAAVGNRTGHSTMGYSILAGGIVLAIMVFPIIISVAVEVLRSVPQEAREASLALGATKWQTVKHVVFRSVAPGIGAAIGLGFSRAFGETMAVLMVVGNVPKQPTSIFDPGYPLPALIANNYGEMMSIPLYDSALMLAALILLAVVLGFNILSALVLRRVQRRFA